MLQGLVQALLPEALSHGGMVHPGPRVCILLTDALDGSDTIVSAAVVPGDFWEVAPRDYTTNAGDGKQLLWR
jgi:hypothetical protein